MDREILAKIDEELPRVGHTRRSLSIAIGRSPSYLRDIERGRSRKPRLEDIAHIAEILGKPIDYFVGTAEDTKSSSELTEHMPINPRIAARAELIADMVTTRLVQRRGIADITHEIRGRIVAAAMDALNESERFRTPVTDEALIPLLVAIIQSLLG